MATERDLRRADQARRWLDEPLFDEIIDDLKIDLLRLIENSGIDERDLREDAYRMLKTIDAFRSRLEQIASETAHARGSEQHRTIMQ